jgi:hypothetical protein
MSTYHSCSKFLIGALAALVCTAGAQGGKGDPQGRHLVPANWWESAAAIVRAVCIDILDFRVRVLVSTRAVDLPIDRLRLSHDRVDLFTRLAVIGK